MRLSRHIGTALLLTGCAGLAQATTIHKWTDADGVTHYSDAAPPASVTDLEQIELPSPSARKANAAADDYYSIANQWRRLHRERIELERARADRSQGTAAAPPGDETIVIQVPESRRPVAVLPRFGPRSPRPGTGTEPRGRHPFAIPGRDWPVGLHPERMRLRGGFESR